MSPLATVGSNPTLSAVFHYFLEQDFHSMNDTKYWVRFSLIPTIEAVKFSRLERHLGDLESAWRVSASELKAAGLDAKSVEAVLNERSEISLDDELLKLKHYRVEVLTKRNATYPSRLKEIYDPPPVLCLRGSLITDETASLVLRQLSTEPIHIDEVCRQSSLPMPTVSSTLAMMELKGVVRQVGHMNYILAREARADNLVKVE